MLRRLFSSPSIFPWRNRCADFFFQLGTAIGVTVSTVVFNNVGLNIPPGGDLISKYRAAQWAAFAFGCIGMVYYSVPDMPTHASVSFFSPRLDLLATVLCIISFRGVGVVGQRGPPKPNPISENEKGTHSTSTPSDPVTKTIGLPGTLSTGGLHKNDLLSASTHQIDQSYVTSSNSGTAYSSSANTFVQQIPLGSSDTTFLKAKGAGTGVSESKSTMTTTTATNDEKNSD